LLDRKNVRYQIDRKFIDTGTDHFGAVVGNNCAIGASVIILPGRQIPSNAVIQAGTVVGKEKIDCIPTVNQTGLMISFAPGNPFFSSSPVILHVTQIC